MWLRIVDSFNHSMGLRCKPQSYASFAGLEVGVARLWTRPLVCSYIQWLCNARAACGTYVVIWMYFIISEQMVIILYIEFIQLALMCFCQRKMSSAVNLYSDDVIVDVITIRVLVYTHHPSLIWKDFPMQHLPTRQVLPLQPPMNPRIIPLQQQNCQPCIMLITTAYILQERKASQQHKESSAVVIPNLRAT
jgi:hypothetical protein